MMTEGGREGWFTPTFLPSSEVYPAFLCGMVVPGFYQPSCLDFTADPSTRNPRAH